MTAIVDYRIYQLADVWYSRCVHCGAEQATITQNAAQCYAINHLVEHKVATVKVRYITSKVDWLLDAPDNIHRRATLRDLLRYTNQLVGAATDLEKPLLQEQIGRIIAALRS